MSYQATTWAWEQPVKPAGAKIVLLHLANAANPDNNNETWHKFDTIARRCGMAKATVSKNMALLEELGYVTLLARSNGIGSTNRYRLNVGRVEVEIGPANQCEPNSEQGVSCELNSERTEPNSEQCEPNSEQSRSLFSRKTVIEPISETVNKQVRGKPAFQPPDWMPMDRWAQYLYSRKEKKHPMNPASLNLCVKAIEKVVSSGIPIDTVFDHMVASGWRTVKADWIRRTEERSQIPDEIETHEERAQRIAKRKFGDALTFEGSVIS